MDNALPLELRFYSCGPGETITITFPGGDVGMVDSRLPDDAAKQRMSAALRQVLAEGQRFRFLCLSHPHRDHCTGMAQILSDFDTQVEEFWHSGKYLDLVLEFMVDDLGRRKVDFRRLFDEVFRVQQVRRQLEEDNLLRIRDLGEGELLGEYGGVRVTALGPGEPEWRALLQEIAEFRYAARGGRAVREPDWNHVSNVLLLEYGESAVVLGGDALGPVWNWLSVQDFARPPYQRLRFSLIKAPHHGARDAYTGRLYERQLAEEPDTRLCVIVCGRDPSAICPEMARLGSRPDVDLCFLPGATRPLPERTPPTAQRLLRAFASPRQEPTAGGMRALVWPDGRVEVDTF